MKYILLGIWPLGFLIVAGTVFVVTYLLLELLFRIEDLYSDEDERGLEDEE